MDVSFCLKTVKKADSLRKIISSVILVTFLSSLITAPAGAQLLPVPGTPVTLSAGFQPPVLLGLKIHPENPLLFDFIVDQGAVKLSDDELKFETEKLVKYFLAALTIPDKEVWVNLSPYEKDKIVPDALGQTAMGKTMLEQDYMLKQLASSLTNPDEKLGREFWATVKNQVQSQLRTADVPMNTFNKVWIVPQKAEVLESQGVVIVGEKRLKVMMDQDYVASREAESRATARDMAKAKDVNSISSGIFKETVLPSIEKEINEGKNFADVRQIYNSVILATWYKKALKESLLGKVYADQSKVAGVETDDKDMKQKIYEQYLAAFKKGVYNLIKEESDSTGDMIPRKYFSGGIKIANFTANSSLVTRSVSLAQAGQIIENAGSKAVRVQMAEPNSTERDTVIVSAAAASSGVVGAGNNVITPQGPYAIWQLSSKLYNAGYRAEEFSNFLNRISGGDLRSILSDDLLDRLAVDQSPVKTIINEWMQVVQSGNQDYFSAERLVQILDLVRQSLREFDQHNFLDFYLEDRAVLYVPILPSGARPTQILFGNEKVNVVKTDDNQLKITDSQGRSVVAALDEEVLVGRKREFPNGALKFTDTTVSGTQFGVALRRSPQANFYYFEIRDGYAPKGSANKTVVVTDGVPANSIRMRRPENSLLTREEFLSPPKADDTFQQSRVHSRTSGLIQVFVGGSVYNIWREGNKVLFQADESQFKQSVDTRIFQGDLATTYRVGSAETPESPSIQGNDWFIQGNRLMSRMSSGGHFSFSLNPNGSFTVTNLTLRQTGTLVKWVASSAVAETPASELLTSIAANAQAVYDMLADFEKPGVEVSEQFKQQIFQWKDNITVLQQQSVVSTDLESLAVVEQQIAAIKNTIEGSFHVWIRQGNNTALKNWKFTNSYDFQGRVMYHVVPGAVWQAQKNGDYYRSDRFGADGFINFFANIDTALAAANRFYGPASEDIVVLKVNAPATTGGGRLAIDNGEFKYPHLYGAMPTNAVIEEIVLGRNKSGVLEMAPDILKREQSAASSGVAELKRGELALQISDLGLTPVANSIVGEFPDRREYVLRLYQNTTGDDYTVLQVNDAGGDLRDFRIYEVDLTGLTPAQLQARYDNSVASSGVGSFQNIAIALGAKIVSFGPEARQEFFALLDEILLAPASQVKDNKSISEMIGSQTRVRAAVREVFDQFAADAQRSQYALTDLSQILGMTGVTILVASSGVISPVLEDSFLVNGYSQGAIASDIMNRNVASYKKEDVVAAINAAGKSENVEDLAAIVAEYESADTLQIYKTRAYQLLNDEAFRDSFMAAYVGKGNNYFTRLENQARDAVAILNIKGQNVEQLTAEFDRSYQGDQGLKDIRAKRDLIKKAQQFIAASSGVVTQQAKADLARLASDMEKQGVDRRITANINESVLYSVLLSSEYAFSDNDWRGSYAGFDPTTAAWSGNSALRDAAVIIAEKFLKMTPIEGGKFVSGAKGAKVRSRDFIENLIRNGVILNTYDYYSSYLFRPANRIASSGVALPEEKVLRYFLVAEVGARIKPDDLRSLYGLQSSEQAERLLREYGWERTGDKVTYVKTSASSGVTRRDVLGAAAGVTVGGVLSADAKAQDEKVLLVTEGPFESKAVGRNFYALKDGPFNLTGAKVLRLTFPPEQEGVKFFVRLLPRFASVEQDRYLNTKIYTIPKGGGVVDIPMSDFPISSLENIRQISLHSGSRAWEYYLDQDKTKQAVPQKIETVGAASAPVAVDANKFTKGGIDFDPTNMNLQIKRDGKGVPLPLPQQNLEQINIQGLVPIIINIVPMNTETLPIFLGQAEKEPGREPETALNAAS